MPYLDHPTSTPVKLCTGSISRSTGSVCILAASLVWLMLSSLLQAKAPSLVPKKTYVLIAGVLEWPSKNFSPYSKERRQDKKLYETLIAQGVPTQNIKLLLDMEATDADIKSSLESLAREAKQGSTFIFYYAGHGYPGSQGIYFACYDAGYKKGPKEGFLSYDVSRILNKHFKGERVLLFADCCHSGGLSDVARKLANNGFKAASLTSASVSSLSTSNWTFTCSIIDSLEGRRLHDHDRNGHVSISEAAKEVRNAMNFVESQKNGFSLYGVNASLCLSLVKNNAPPLTKIDPPYQLGQYVKLKEKALQTSQTARIIGSQQGKLKLEIQGYNKRELIFAKKDQLSKHERPKPPKAKALPAPMSAEKAAKKATMEGKYSQLLKKFSARMDYLQYGFEKDYGHYPQTDYMGQKDLPAGYWVYIYPDWYIFKSKTEP